MLTDIREVRRGSKRRLLIVDDEPWRVAPAEVLREAGLKAGDDATISELSARLSEVEKRCARDRAVRLMTYRERSSAELSSRLEEDGFLPGVVTETVARFCDLGLVDDDRFAHALARNLTGVKSLGRVRALREMIVRGVDADAAAAILDETLPPEDEESAALTSARTFARRPGATRERVAARLMRRGYAPRIALSAAREACEGDVSGYDDGLWGASDPEPSPGDEETF